MSDLPETRSIPRAVMSRFRRPSLRHVNRLILGSNRTVSNSPGTNRPGSIDAGLGQGMEMALTVVLFFGIGWLIDSRFDTRPIFTIAFVVFATIGQSIRMWIAYDARMKVLEQERRQRANAHLESGSR